MILDLIRKPKGVFFNQEFVIDLISFFCGAALFRRFCPLVSSHYSKYTKLTVSPFFYNDNFNCMLLILLPCFGRFMTPHVYVMPLALRNIVIQVCLPLWHDQNGKQDIKEIQLDSPNHKQIYRKRVLGWQPNNIV